MHLHLDLDLDYYVLRKLGVRIDLRIGKGFAGRAGSSKAELEKRIGLLQVERDSLLSTVEHTRDEISLLQRTVRSQAATVSPLPPLPPRPLSFCH